MNSDKLVEKVRLEAGIKTTSTDYTTAVILEMLSSILTSVFPKYVVNSKGGYWRKRYEFTTTATRSRYRIPSRAVAQMVQSIELENSEGTPYEFEGDQIVFLDGNGEEAPLEAGLTLRLKYYIRPSALYVAQTVARVTDITGQVITTTGGVPTNRVTSAAVVSGDAVDIIHPNGWHELSLVSGVPTISGGGNTWTFPAGTNLNEVEVGDYIRAEGQTDWPCLPEDVHLSLARLAAIEILNLRSFHEKAKNLHKLVFGDGTKENTGDISKWADIIQPRAKNSPPVFVPRGIYLRARGRGLPLR